jgi:hypothetical protein
MTTATAPAPTQPQRRRSSRASPLASTPAPTSADAPGDAQAATDATGTAEATEAARQETMKDTDNVGDQAPRPDPMSRAAQLADWQHQIQEQEGICAVREAEWQDAKEAAKRAKREYEVSVRLLRRLIREFSDPQRKLPFESKPAEPAPDPDAWKAASIEVLGLTPRIVKVLLEAGIDTLGKIADHSDANDGLNGITGIGPAAREQVSDAMEKYWRDHPRPATSTSEPKDDDDTDDDEDFDDDTDDTDNELGGEE